MNKAAPLVDVKSGMLDRRIFVDDDVHQQELEQVFGRCWLFIGHESQISKPNDFISAYMGEDPILVARDAKNKIHAFLNMCRHRGNRICRADYGNAPSFMCTYHGWTFATDGKLVGVPGYKEAYFEELDRSQWGLVEAAQIDTYKGLVFATWDKNAPSLKEYMGDMAWWLDLLVDRRDGGTEVIGGADRWTLNCNWKLGADNFAGDGYHFPITHGSSINVGAVRQNQGDTASQANTGRHPVNVGNGHNVLGGYDGPGTNPSIRSRSSSVITDYYAQTLPELEARLGAVRGKQAGINVANMFPNFTWHPAPLVRCWQPRGPGKTEIWSYCIVDKKAPPEVKAAMRRNHTLTFSASGIVEQDDMNNFIQVTSTSRSPRGKNVPINQMMGIGHETKHEFLPGTISPANVSETNQRAFYARWQEMMDASSWSDIHIDRKTTI